MKNVIEKIGDWCIEQIFDFDRNECEYESGCVEPENGVYEKPSVSVYAKEYFNGHFVNMSANTSDNSVEILFEDDEYENLEKAVNDYVAEKLDFDDLFYCARDDYEEHNMSIFERNGFRNEADYNHYRYSA